MNAWTARRPSSNARPGAPTRGRMATMLAACAGITLSAASAASGQLFTAGNLVVSRVNEWIGTGGSYAGVVTLMEYIPAGAFTGATVLLPSSPPAGLNHMCTINCTNLTEGLLARSVDGQFLVMGGYDAAPGSALVSASTFPRVIARIDSAGTVDTTTALTNVFSGASFRAVCSLNGSAFWLAGASQGVAYATLGATSGTIISSPGPTNTRSVNIFSNKLYVGALASGYRGVSAVGAGAPPTAGANAVTLLSGMPGAVGSSSPGEFFFADANTLYLADGSDLSISGGVQKWTYDSSTSTWSLQYTMNTGLSGGVCALTGQVSGSGTVTLYATTADNVANDLVSVTDTGASSAFTTLAQAGVGAAFRGVAFAPDGPAPATGACCIVGTCSIMTAAACGLGTGGVYFGNGVACSSVVCPSMACYANCDSSTTQPILNVLDFACFLNKFAAGNTYANCDGSTQPPILNVNDFACYLNKYAAGCS